MAKDPELIKAQRELSKTTGVKLKLEPVGSFLSMIIEDPEGELTAKAASDAWMKVGWFMKDKAWVPSPSPLTGYGWLNGRFIATWTRH